VPLQRIRRLQLTAALARGFQLRLPSQPTKLVKIGISPSGTKVPPHYCFLNNGGTS
jgi:hypothetical protein